MENSSTQTHPFSLSLKFFLWDRTFPKIFPRKYGLHASELGSSRYSNHRFRQIWELNRRLGHVHFIVLAFLLAFLIVLSSATDNSSDQTVIRGWRHWCRHGSSSGPCSFHPWRSSVSVSIAEAGYYYALFGFWENVGKWNSEYCNFHFSLETAANELKISLENVTCYLYFLSVFWIKIVHFCCF